MNPFRIPRVVMLGLALTVVAGACGGSSHASTSPTTAAANPGGSTSGGGNGGAAAGGGFPGASGSVASISGSSMEVQNQQSGQVTVSWTSSTSFTKTVTVATTSVAVGDCVTVTGSSSTGALVANMVSVSKPDSSGTCSTGRFGGAGGPGGNPSNGGSLPNGGTRPSAPSGSFPGGGSGFGFATGKVTSINAAQMVIDGISSSTLGGARNGTQASTPPSSIKSSPVTIGLSSSTSYTEMESTAASSLAVGDCVAATGSTDSTGAVAAQSVRITSTGGQSCAGGFPGGGGAGGAANGGGGTGNGGSNG